MEKKKCFVDGFSLVEFVVVFLVLAVVSGVSAPVLFKKSLNLKLRALNSVSAKCDVSNPACAAFYDSNGQSRCRIFKKYVENGSAKYACVLCRADLLLGCGAGKYFDGAACKCVSCRKFDTVSCSNCCSRCNSRYCTGCALGVGLPAVNRTLKMGCVECSKGQYSDSNKDEPCRLCPRGTYQPGKRKTSVSDCKKCRKGHFCDVLGLGDPKPCAVGTFQDEEGGVSCKICPVGHICPESGMEAASICPRGTYQPSVGQVSCRSCADVLLGSTTAREGAEASSECVCPAGKYIIQSSPLNRCGVCGVGTYRVRVFGEIYRCETCPAGFRCPGDGKKYPCLCGSYSSSGAEKCSSAPPGHFTPRSVDGFYTSVSPCVGSSFSSGGACSCSDCSSGSYVDVDHTSCTSCKTVYGANCRSCDGVRCTECEAGYGKSSESSKTSNACYCRLVSEAQKASCKDSGSFYVQTDDVEGEIGCSGLCVKKFNAGDLGGTPIPEGVTVYNPSDYYYASAVHNDEEVANKTPVCWGNKGRTASSWYVCNGDSVYRQNNLCCGNGSRCNNNFCCNFDNRCENLFSSENSYSTQNRTVCNYSAAKKICESDGWRLPTKDELDYFHRNFALNQALNPCYEFNDGCPYSQCAPLQNACFGSAASGPNNTGEPDDAIKFGNTCHPHGIWGEGQYSYITRNSGKRTGINLRHSRFAFSVRCVRRVEGW